MYVSVTVVYISNIMWGTWKHDTNSVWGAFKYARVGNCITFVGHYIFSTCNCYVGKMDKRQKCCNSSDKHFPTSCNVCPGCTRWFTVAVAEGAITLDWNKMSYDLIKLELSLTLCCLHLQCKGYAYFTRKNKVYNFGLPVHASKNISCVSQ